MATAFQSSAFQTSAFQLVAADDDHGHWHYAKLQKRRRAQEKALRAISLRELPPRIIPAIREKIVSQLVSRATTTVLPIARADGQSGVASSLSTVATTRILPVVKFSGADRHARALQCDVNVRIVNVLEELRDLEDMVDLYKLLMAA